MITSTTFRFDQHPAGVSVGLAFKGETARIAKRALLTSDDPEFMNYLEAVMGFFDLAFSSVGIVSHATVRTFVATIQPDRHATLYWNEALTQHALVRPKKEVAKGDPVYKNDIAECAALELRLGDKGAIAIPDNCGVVLLLRMAGGRDSILIFCIHPIQHAR